MAKRNNKQRNNLKPLNLTKDGMIRQARYGGYYHKPKNNSFASGGNIKPINAGSIMQGYVDSNPAHSGDVSKISNPLSSFNPDISGFGMSHLMGGVNLAGNIIGMSQASIDPMISANIQLAQSFNPYSQSKDELMDEWGSHANMGYISRKLAGGKNEGQMGMGALQGAASGAAIGSIVPGIGTAIGAGVGALGSLVGGIFGNRSAKRKLRRANALIDEANIMAQNSFINRAQGIDSQFSHGLMSNYFKDGGNLNNMVSPNVSTKENPIFAHEDGYGEIRKKNPIPLNTPYGKQYSNIVEKQNHFDSLSEKYGSRVKYREDFLNLYDKPLETPETVVVNYTMDDYNPSNPNLDKLPQPSKDVQQKLDKYHDLISQHGLLEKKENRDKFLLENYSKEELESMSEENKSDILLDKMRHIRNEYYEIAKEISPMLRDESILEGQKTTWRKEFESRDDISNKSLLYSSMMEEGGNKYRNKTIISGFSHFGIDRIGDILDELIDGGYLEKDIKNRLEIYPAKNEKNEHINTADFQNFTDVITVKNAILNQEKDLILKVAKKENIKLSDKAIDYFTLAGYNGGRNNAAKMLKKFKKDGLLENDKFLEDGPDSYKRIHENVMRRLDIANMLEGEGVIKSNKNILGKGGYLNNNTNIMKNKKYINVFSHGGNMNQFALGGEFDLGINMVDTGGTHEENPMGGVPMGVDEEGTPNMVEEGEVIYDDYVFSNRLFADENTLIDNLLNVNYADFSFAKIAEEISKKYEDHPNDPIAKRGLKIEMDRLIAAQEAVKDEEAEEEMGMQLAEAAQGQEQLILGGGIDQNPMLNPGMLEDVMGGLNMDLSGLEEMNPEMMNQDMNLFAEGGDLNEGSENIDNEEIMNAEKSDKDIKGRLSKNHTVKTIAELHGVDVSLIKEQLEKGIEVEYEHTDSKGVARRIAMDHLVELPDYYDRLEAMEKLGERELSGEEDLIDGYNQELMMAQELMMGLEQMMGQSMMGPNMFPDGGWFNKVHGPDFKWGTLFTPTSRQLSISLLQSGKYNVQSAQQPSQGNIIPVQSTPDTNSFDLSRFQKYNTSINPLDKYASIIGGNPSEVRLPLNHHTVYSKAADERRMREHNKSQQRSGNLQDLRYTPALGAGLMSISDMMGWTNKPDHSYAEMVGRSADGMREYTPDKLGDYLEYTPFDIDYQQNKMAAQAGASRRAMTDLVGGNRGAAMAGLTALDRGAQDAMGDLGILADQYNLQLRQQAAEFNRGTNMFNAQQDMQAHQMNLRREHAQMQARMNQAQMMMQSDAMSSQAKSANLSNMLQSIGDIGRESFARLMIMSNPSLYYSIDSKGNVSYKNGYHQLPPNEKALVDRAAEIQKYKEEIEKLQSKQGEKRETKNNKKAKGGSLKRVKRK